jgi:hypothetical protein
MIAFPPPILSSSMRDAFACISNAEAKDWQEPDQPHWRIYWRACCPKTLFCLQIAFPHAGS